MTTRKEKIGAFTRAQLRHGSLGLSFISCAPALHHYRFLPRSLRRVDSAASEGGFLPNSNRPTRHIKPVTLSTWTLGPSETIFVIVPFLFSFSRTPTLSFSPVVGTRSNLWSLQHRRSIQGLRGTSLRTFVETLLLIPHVSLLLTLTSTTSGPIKLA